MDKDKELVWKKLSEPVRTWPPKEKTAFSLDGKKLFRDLYGDGGEIDEYELVVPFQVETATYKLTEYCRAWEKK